MLGSLLALALTAAPQVRQVVIYPLRHPDGRDAQAAALQRLVETSLTARGVVLGTGGNDGFAACNSATCLNSRTQARPGEAAVVASWTSFGASSVLTLVVVDDREGHQAFELAAPAASDFELPLIVNSLATQLGDKLDLPPPGEVRHPEADHLTFGLSLKVGNTIGATQSTSKFSGLNLNFALEGDYLAAPEFWPFVDLSVVLARATNGQRVQLVPFLLGAKYVFRKGHDLRPFLGMALGLSFLAQNPDADTGTSSTFEVNGVGGVNWSLFDELALVAEAKANLNGLEASGSSGLVAAMQFNFGALVLF
ncbi:MAG: hypothetical protein JST54_20100 [Deltaproteobacteria bacterium]|nr:hypothetical protein [Deltaproteobacteria bacterium]